ncbi:MAG: DUF5777 family beta-barrel protein [Salinivirgaceae bacterium]|jgi:hypothetical protein
MKKLYLPALFVLWLNYLNGQDLMALLDSANTIQTQKEFVQGTFRSVRLINSYTSEIAEKNDLVFSISHRFDPINSGAYELWGLDHSEIRFGFEYGLTNRISLGLGRSSHEKLYDGFIKIKIARQSSGAKSFPLTITLLEGMDIKTYKYVDDVRDYPFSARLYYTHELFISRKINNYISAQVVPTLLHRNMVITKEEQNLVPAIGFGSNVTVNKWLSFSGEYFYLLPGNTADNYSNSLAFTMELESGGGHIFQITLANSHGMTEKSFIPETTGKWIDGDIQLGFNIIRVFHPKKK